MMSGQTIIHSDYMNADTVMMSAATLRDRIFHSRVIRQTNRRTEQTSRVVSHNARHLMLDDDDFEKEHVQICIQNDDKLITYLNAVKKKPEAISVIFTDQTYVTILVKAPASHPILVMRFPIDNHKVYSRTPGLFYLLPLAKVITRTTAEFAKDNTYALYYKKSMNESSGKVQTSIYYKSGAKVAYEPDVEDTNAVLVNKLLYASTISYRDPSVSKRSSDEDNIMRLNQMVVQMLVDIPTINSFKEIIDKELTIDFVVAATADGTLDMTMISKFAGGSVVERPLVDESNALLWQFRTPATYTMYDRTPLLLQSVNNGIKLGTHYLYFAFCRYGDEYTFLKIVSSKAIVMNNANSSILLGKLFEGASYVYEMYFCHSIKE